MYTTKSGQKFGSSMVGKKKDAMGAANKGEQVMGATSPEAEKKAPAAPSVFGAEKPAAPEQEQEQKPMQEDPKKVAMEHGPATDVTIHHDHKSGKHMVVSHHPNGHMHTSNYASAKDAHDAATQLSGGDQQPVAGAAPEAPEADGFSVPKLA